MKYDVNAVKARIPLHALVSQDQPLVQVRGELWKGRDHDSLVVQDDKGLWFWNSQGKGGDHVSWLIEQHGLTFVESMARLQEIVDGGIAVHNWPRTSVEKPKLPTPPATLAAMADSYHHALDRVGREWWYKRGLDDMDIDNWNLGYCSNHWDLGPSYTIPIIEAGKLVNIRHRIVKPIDHAGKYKPQVTGLGISIFNGDEMENGVIIVEGEIKTMVLCHYGFSAIGLMGCQSFKAEWMERFKAIRHIYIALDPGINPQNLAWCNKLAAVSEVRTLTLTDKPDDFLISDPRAPQWFCKYIRDSRLLIVRK